MWAGGNVGGYGQGGFGGGFGGFRGVPGDEFSIGNLVGKAEAERKNRDMNNMLEDYRKNKEKR
jgi:hypothetical protein